MPTRPRHAHKLSALLLILLTLVPGAVLAAPPRVVVSILPLHSLASAVMEGVAEPKLLLRGNQSPHTFSLRPSEARLLRDADLVLWIGPSLETPLARILSRLANDRTLAMIDAPGITRLALRDGGHDHEATDTAHDPGYDVDPHIWLSPANAAAIASTLADALLEIDPKHAPAYRANLNRLTERLAQLDRALIKRFDALSGNFAVYHDAFQYLEERYGLHSAGALSKGADRVPGAAHVQQMLEHLRHEKVRCVFSEPQFRGRSAKMIGDTLDIRHTVLDPLGADVVPGPGAYFVVMQNIADAMTLCMQYGTDE